MISKSNIIVVDKTTNLDIRVSDLVSWENLISRWKTTAKRSGHFEVVVVF